MNKCIPFHLQFGAISILFRQTNIIWMLFFSANGAITYVQDLPLSDYVSHENSKLSDKSSTEVSDKDNTASLRRRRTNSSIRQRRVVSGSTNCNISKYSLKNFHILFQLLLQAFRSPLGFVNDMLNIVLQSGLQNNLNFLPRL
jgi:hypothetical protein